MTNSTSASLELEPKLIQGLEKAAAELHCGKNQLLNIAVNNFLKQFKDIKQLENEKLSDLWLDNYDFGE
ncbi:hypothetical protein BA173_04555 [Rickettsia sp. MEAM1 (Bemisia tabaci)]|uniref:hypothetical protein n=1 Tax=unclassified Rickettsia TaxID=114295 RepID=UPI000315E92B|nr:MULTISPECIES: hypothetical protein [unclassified Rickettsia]MCC8370101.1 hypothetical protein [Rickettsia endosymbiont of Stiretrus anchorago]MCC8378127.1 hypothetical protein [Rickettsia endosymbiont of Graphium doson]HJD66250.1 hypothetical protein [Rickettsia endosymbiont of Bembidion nr. Transversale]ASX28090.1 hypothetical protein BA173_04555 [Rickettsia sp. MEAM1 (Bemisia tabaci)]ODA37445.1 hypothetical protein A8V33_02275 [Rickettsia sp. wb]